MLNETDLHDYQRHGIDAIKQNRFYALFLDMGLGKTVTTLTAIKQLIYDDLDVSRVLIVAPKRVAENVWTSEIENWSHLKGLKISRIIGDEKKRKAALKEKADVYTIGRDNIAWLCGQFGGGMLPFDMLVIDESSSFKNPKSMRFKSLRMVQPCFNRVVLLTGTPAPNGLIDLWSQIYLLDRGQRLGKTITKYRDDYFKPGQRNGAIVYNYRIKQDGEKRIHERISDICMSMKAEDYLQLPGRVDNYIKVQFDAATQKKYNDFERDQVLNLITENGSAEVSAMSAATLSNKLMQFANGAVYDENKTPHVVHDLKLEAVEDIIEAAQGQPVLIAYTYESDRERLKDKLSKYKPVVLKTEQHIKDWNAGKIQVLIMHPASGGHGLNLQAGGHIVVWFGMTWSSELYQQFNGRLDRQGQKEVVIINHIVACDTIDQDVVKSLSTKITTERGLLEAVKARIKKYAKNI
ncbi:MAG: DEAD/DEAH box helicase [Clostridiaceae bacterium]|nr:DEAD/DEAH box helicase [Clostridiaceae bacterium]